MKKALSLLLALVMALSLTVPALAADGEKSGTTPLTAIKETPFSYEIVIPTNVAAITSAGVYEVGQAKVTNVVSAMDETVISYTATTTAFKCEGKSDLPATYYTEEAAENAFPTTAVRVYEHKADAESIPTMWVKITEDDWNAAADGTYNATVTYNFEAIEDALIINTIADAIATVSDRLCIRTSSGGLSYGNGCPEWTNENGFRLYEQINGHGEGSFELWLTSPISPDGIYLSLDTALTRSGNAYTCTVEGVTYTFNFADNALTSVTVSGSSYNDANGVFIRPTLIGDILASTSVPTSENPTIPPSGAWVNQSNAEAKMFVCDGVLCFLAPGGMIGYPYSVPLSAVLAKSGDNYLWQNDFGESVTFSMSGNVLQSVTLTVEDTLMFGEMFGNALGTYMPAS